MGQINPENYPFIEIADGLKFIDDPHEGDIGIKPVLDITNRVQRIMACLGNTDFCRHLDTNDLVGKGLHSNYFSPGGLLAEFGDGETEEQFEVAAEVCRKHGINAIVIIGGDDSKCML